MTNPTVYVLAGLPGTGKSTWAQITFDDIPIASTDYWIERQAKARGLTYNEAFEEEIKYATKQFNSQVDTFVERGEDFVWDQTNLSRKKRVKILNRIPDKYTKVLVWFEVENDAKWRQQLQRPGKVISDKILAQMTASIEKPHFEEGWDRITTKYV